MKLLLLRREYLWVLVLILGMLAWNVVRAKWGAALLDVGILVVCEAFARFLGHDDP
jgi:hypothetical protein